jgi:hypothetical protein
MARSRMSLLIKIINERICSDFVFMFVIPRGLAGAYQCFGEIGLLSLQGRSWRKKTEWDFLNKEVKCIYLLTVFICLYFIWQCRQYLWLYSVDDRKINELERIRKEAIVVQIKTVAQHLPGRNKKNKESCSQKSRSLGWTFNQKPPQIRSRNANHSISTLGTEMRKKSVPWTEVREKCS